MRYFDVIAAALSAGEDDFRGNSILRLWMNEITSLSKRYPKRIYRWKAFMRFHTWLAFESLLRAEFRWGEGWVCRWKSVYVIWFEKLYLTRRHFHFPRAQEVFLSNFDKSLSLHDPIVPIHEEERETSEKLVEDWLNSDELYAGTIKGKFY